jgi:hypothetical protein
VSPNRILRQAQDVSGGVNTHGVRHHSDCHRYLRFSRGDKGVLVCNDLGATRDDHFERRQ